MDSSAIALCSLKGGTGKTAMAYNLMERSVSSGCRTLLVDYDPQEGSIGLLDLRGSRDWRVVSSRVTLAGSEELGRLKSCGEFDVILCDLPGSDSMALCSLLKRMDLILSPVGVGASDLLTAANFGTLIAQFDLPPVVFLPNNIPFYHKRRRELLEELSELELEVCPVMVQRRVAHLDALRSGLGVCEAFPGSEAAREVDMLWDWVRRRLDFCIHTVLEDSHDSG